MRLFRPFRLFLLFLCMVIGAPAAWATVVPMYQLYSSDYHDYFYTTSDSQRATARDFYGYGDYWGATFWVENSPQPGTAPFRRFYKGSPQTDHFYTTFGDEVNTVLGMGWQDEGNEGYLYTYQAAGTSPLYRLSHFDGNTSDLMHYYTFNWSEVQNLTWYYGWGYDRVAGYAYSGPWPPPLNAEFVDWDVRDQMGAGKRHLVGIRMRNTGTETWWPGQHRLGSTLPNDNTYWGRNRADLQNVTAPGQIGVFGFDISGAYPAGRWWFQWQMVKEGVAWFGGPTPQLLVDTFDVNDLYGALTAATGDLLAGFGCWTSRPYLTTTAYVFHKFNSYDPDDHDIRVGSTLANQPYSACGYPNKGFSFGIPDTRADGIWLKDGRSHWLIVRMIDSPLTNGAYSPANSYQFLPLPDTRPDRSQFISQSVASVITVPSQSPFSMTFQNTGTNTWLPETHRLIPTAPGESWSVGAGLSLPGPIAPGQQVTFTWTPVFTRGAGTYTSVWSVARSGVEFGAATPAVTISYRPTTGGGGGTQPASPYPPSPLPYGQNPPGDPVVSSPPSI